MYTCIHIYIYIKYGRIYYIYNMVKCILYMYIDMLYGRINYIYVYIYIIWNNMVEAGRCKDKFSVGKWNRFFPDG